VRKLLALLDCMDGLLYNIKSRVMKALFGYEEPKSLVNKENSL
jgi:hypothetical protein